ncbi:hypothetical protein CLIB1423_11S03246 [[Candida] railenensis]|uniref:F-box domain-containing protein n=1 Tax=[Candida] railenensis TaxID=45579 RepID=A0A9P0VZ23_9ASCO|nr:hypothetical protein CLIB1423_11S03246 [[Candida] railenensis]
MSVDQSLNIAIDCFKRKKYAEALEIYNSIVRKIQKIPSEELQTMRVKNGLTPTPIIGPIVHPKIGSILDQRAATYEKLNNPQRALRDGENLIKLEPISCKGYLRVAKLHTIMGNELETYKVLQRGVYTIESAIKKFRITVPEKLFESLKSKYAELNTKLKKRRNVTQPVGITPGHVQARVSQSSLDDLMGIKRAKRNDSVSRTPSLNAATASLDPFDYFPLELVCLIFMHLPFSTVLRCHLVSRNWYKSLTSIPSLYTNIAFRNRLDKVEFQNGIKLIKKVHQNSSNKLIKSLKLSKSYRQEYFCDIIKFLAFQSNLKFENLDIVNSSVSVGELLLSLIFSKVNTSNVSPNGLQPFETSLKSLKLGVTSEIKHIPYLLGISDKLEELEIIQLSSHESNKTVYNQQQYPSIKQTFKDRMNADNLKRLSFIGYTDEDLKQNSTSVMIPILNFISNKASASLKSLTIVSQNLVRFNSSNVSFNQFPCLEEVYFEDNSGYSLSDFILGFTSTGSGLKKLVFREKELNTEFDVSTLRNLEFPRLSNLQLLDVYSCNLTRDGLYKLLQVVNKESNQLTSLNIGNSRKLSFQIDTFQRRISQSNPSGHLSISKILKLSPNLTHLYLNEIEFDNFSAKMFYHELQEYDSNFENIKLKFIDLSFARLDGIGLMSLFCVSSKHEPTFKLDELVLHGIDIKSQTIQLLMDKGYALSVLNDFHKVKWKEFGINSLIQ